MTTYVKDMAPLIASSKRLLTDRGLRDLMRWKVASVDPCEDGGVLLQLTEAHHLTDGPEGRRMVRVEGQGDAMIVLAGDLAVRKADLEEVTVLYFQATSPIRGVQTTFELVLLEKLQRNVA